MSAIITMIPLSQLAIDKAANVRHANRGVDPVLVASIKAIGLQHPLTVRKNGEGYAVIDGGQRLLALKEIAGKTDADVPVVITEKADAWSREISLQLNLARQAMHPVDEYRAFVELTKDGLTTEEISGRFGVSERTIHQRLALGALDKSVLDAWLAGEIDAKVAKLFTMQPDKKAQKRAFETAFSGNSNVNLWVIRRELGLDQSNTGQLLALVTEEAYAARGGKITRDLFATERDDNTTVSDHALLRAMADELLEKQIEQLKADGWGTVENGSPGWEHQRIEVVGKATKEEAARLKEIDKLLKAAEKADEELDNHYELGEEKDAIEEAISNRAIASIDPKIKAKGIAFVSFRHDHSQIDIAFRLPPKKEKGLGLEGGKAADKKKAAPADAISQALLLRQAHQMTASAQEAVRHQPHVAMAILIAGIMSNDDALGIHQSANSTKKRPEFAATLEMMLKLSTADQITVLTELVSKNINLVKNYKPEAVLADASHRALVEAIDGKKLTEITRGKFDANDYFASVSRAVIVEAVKEAMGADHASTVAAMTKANAAKFATANLPKTKWLPKQMRVPGYDGPNGRPIQIITPKEKPAAKKAVKAPAKKAAAKKAKR